MYFSSAFSSSFAKGNQFVAPMTAKRMLVDGAAAVVVGNGVMIGGKRLMGIAGGIYKFASPESAAAWIERTRQVGIAEAQIVSLPKAAGWLGKKRERYLLRAAQCVEAAARQVIAGKRIALIEEAATAEEKWSEIG